MSWLYFQEDWALLHKVTFDGPNRRIYLSPNVTTFSLKSDIYSSWKEWMQIRDNSKYTQAFRAVGGDPVGGGLYAGDLYFLMNGWQIVIEHMVQLEGTLYHDDNISNFIIMPGGGVTSTVSNLAYSYAQEPLDIPTTDEIALAVWQFLVQSGTIIPGSAGEMLVKKLLTTNKFIGLK